MTKEEKIFGLLNIALTSLGQIYKIVGDNEKIDLSKKIKFEIKGDYLKGIIEENGSTGRE